MIYTVTLNPALDRELTVPALQFDAVLRASALRVDFGGKGFNVSRALAALGAESVALGFVGGLTGRRIAEGLAGLGIATDFVEIAGETRTNVSIVSQTETHHLKVNEAGPTIAPAEVAALLEKIAALATPGDWWVLSGSLPPGAPVAIYADIIKQVQTAGGRAIVDTSGPPLADACRAAPYLAKPNAVEAGELTGLPVNSPEQVRAAARQMQALGVPHVLVSLGKDGALLCAGEETWLVTPPPIEERNPIGAGDASVAGLVYGLSRGMDWPSALRWSMGSGAATASLPGTAVGSRELVAELAEGVKVGSRE
ncbi:MAG: 1-phosphofructokinase [Anaerolineae bacterium]